MKHRKLFIIAPFILLIMTGCTTMPVLEPNPELSFEPELGTAVYKLKGVYVAVSGDKWEGEEKVREHVTPLEVTINNGHGSLLKISYTLFSLRDTSGVLYSALPPYSIRGSIRKYASQYSCPGFLVAPHYSRFYPSMPAYQDPFYYDPSYYNHYYGCWQNIDLPTPEMLDKALPEGVLKNGAEATGFLYFEKIGQADQYIFEMDLVDAKSGERFGTISIPLIKKE